MDSPYALLVPIIFLGVIAILEYRNPLWRKFVLAGQPLPDIDDPQQSIEIIFFWEGAEEYGKAENSDYWNAMDLRATSNGLAVKRPLFLFGRRSVFIPWYQVTSGKSFYAWLTKRRTLSINGSNLYFSVTEKFYKHYVCQYIESAR